MALRLATALLLACHAANAFEMPGNLNLVARATTTADDPGVTACSIAYAAVDSCYSESPGLSTAAETDAASCLCCHSTAALYEYYESCAVYISDFFPASSSQYSAFATLGLACASEMPQCGAAAGGGATVTSTAPTTRPTATRTGAGGAGGGGSATDIPDACTLFADIVSSCIEATPSITAAPDSVAARCVCYTTQDGTSSFTTEIDDLASSCAPWAKTAADSSFYEGVTAFENFCEAYAPATGGTGGATTSKAATRTGGGFGAGGGGAATPSKATTSPTSSPTATKSAPGGGLRPNGAVAVGAGGFVVRAAEVFSLVLSFFFLI